MKGDEQLKTCSKCRKKSKKNRERNPEAYKTHASYTSRYFCNICNKEISRRHKSRHERTKKHQKYINLLQ